MIRARRSVSGVGKLGCLVWIVVVGAIAYVAAQIIPVKMKTSEFYDAMQEQAQFGSIKGDKSIQQELFLKAQELKLPLKKEDISVVRDGSKITIEVHYQINLVFPGYTYVWNEDRVVTRPLFAV
jgi:hypothetical protein